MGKKYIVISQDGERVIGSKKSRYFNKPCMVGAECLNFYEKINEYGLYFETRKRATYCMYNFTNKSTEYFIREIKV